MPTKRRKISREMLPDGVSQVALHFLTDGLIPLPPDSENEVLQWHLSAAERETALDRYEAQILMFWIEKKPGTRPSWWWKKRAPEPQRRRLGGVGTPEFACLAVVERYEYGIPASFISKWLVDYYNGRTRDIHGKTNSRGQAIDPSDPPLYESEASFLKRHGLLAPTEERRLRPADFEPEEILED